MPNPRAPADPDAAMILGELRGQLRELIHNQNNEAQKGVARDEKLTKLSAVPDDIAEIKKAVGSIDRRLTHLEADKSRREGERGVLNTMMKSPLLAWIFAAAVIAWTWIKGDAQ